MKPPPKRVPESADTFSVASNSVSLVSSGRDWVNPLNLPRYHDTIRLFPRPPPGPSVQSKPSNEWKGSGGFSGRP